MWADLIPTLWLIWGSTRFFVVLFPGERYRLPSKTDFSNSRFLAGCILEPRLISLETLFPGIFLGVIMNGFLSSEFSEVYGCDCACVLCG